MKFRKFIRKNPLPTSWRGITKKDILAVVQTQEGKVKGIIIKGIGLVKA